ncbi:MAG: peptide deformylase [bacterium]|nr:peptide deformylase [bacterium]MDZ4285849.1 peptide deformylase [Candidatus Sungbacteria bacterium]
MTQKTLPIVKEPHLVLRKLAHDITVAEISSKKIQDLLAAMKETLKGTTDGVGLAAPQVGESLRIFIISEEAEEIDRHEEAKRKQKDTRDHEEVRPYPVRGWKYYVFINPKAISQSRKKLEGAEGCLSVPGIFGSIKRHEKITVQAYDEHGKKFTRGESRFFARVMQHELDHLEGTLFIDTATHIVKPA